MILHTNQKTRICPHHKEEQTDAAEPAAEIAVCSSRHLIRCVVKRTLKGNILKAETPAHCI